MDETYFTIRTFIRWFLIFLQYGSIILAVVFFIKYVVFQKKPVKKRRRINYYTRR